jgi:tripartite-type tricarboxylate transporter receptor subunit TctC
MRKIVTALVAPVVGLGLLAVPHASAADSSANAFYKSNVREMKMIIGVGGGGSYDLYAHVLALHMRNHIPGRPNITPVNMPGASGIKAANWVANQGPQDGSVLSNIRYNFAMYQALDNLPQVKTDMRKFHWIGSINATNHVLATYYKVPVKTFDGLKKMQILIGETSPRSFGTLMCQIYNALLDTKLKVIPGYGDTTKVKLAMERGEVQGMGDNGWSDLKVGYPDMLKKHQLNTLMQVGLKKELDLPDVPLLIDQAKGDPMLKAELDFVTKSAASMGKPFATSPGVPADRVALLRKAFDDTMKDPAFLKDAEKIQVEVEPIGGAEIQQIVADIMSAPKSVTNSLRHDLGFDKPHEDKKGKKKS